MDINLLGQAPVDENQIFQEKTQAQIQDHHLELKLDRPNILSRKIQLKEL